MRLPFFIYNFTNLKYPFNWMLAHWQFYKTIFPFIAGSGIMSTLIFGPIIGYILFLTIGLGIGWLGFISFNKNEFYFYFNLGIIKYNLFKFSFIINFLVGTPIYIILMILIFFIFGNLTIT